MIARIWHGTVNKRRSAEYLNLMRSVALPDYRSVSGNLAAHVLRRDEGAVSHFLTVTFWDSMESIAVFAGDEVSAAKYYEFDKDFLLELEPTVEHYEVYSDWRFVATMP